MKDAPFYCSKARLIRYIRDLGRKTKTTEENFPKARIANIKCEEFTTDYLYPNFDTLKKAMPKTGPYLVFDEKQFNVFLKTIFEISRKIKIRKAKYYCKKYNNMCISYREKCGKCPNLISDESKPFDVKIDHIFCDTCEYLKIYEEHNSNNETVYNRCDKYKKFLSHEKGGKDAFPQLYKHELCLWEAKPNARNHAL